MVESKKSLIVLCIICALAVVAGLVRIFDKIVGRYKTRGIIAVLVFSLAVIFGIAAGINIYLNKTYGWFYSYEKSVMKQHPAVRSMKLYEKYPGIGITYYTKSADKNEMDAILKSTKNVLLHSGYKKQIDDSYRRLNNNLSYITITVDFEVNGDGKADIQCESDLSGSTWSDWTWYSFA